MLDSAIQHGEMKVVVLSTDKAAYPVNSMGISKIIMEKVAIAKKAGNWAAMPQTSFAVLSMAM